MTAFDTCYPSLIKAEGGFVSDPMDAGGMTNLGVTKRAWEAWVGHPVTEQDMRAFTPASVAPFYRVKYWNAVHCDSFPVPLALCLFHACVNTGPARAAEFLQALVGATPDGAIGPGTIAATTLWTMKHGLKATVDGYQDNLAAYHKTRPTFPRFGKGWLNRDAEIKKLAEGMIV
jgi:lysozyme family protein